MERKLKGGLMEYLFFLHRDRAKQIPTSLLSSASILTAFHNNKEGIRHSILLRFRKIFAGTDVADAKLHTKESYHTNRIP